MALRLAMQRQLKPPLHPLFSFCLLPVLLLLLSLPLLMLSRGANGAEAPASLCPTSFSYPCTCTASSAQSVNVLCHGGSLASISLPLKSLPNNTTIDSLVITNSSISKLFGPIFEHLSVNKLSITYSKVSVITQDVLAPLISSLNALDLEGNELDSLPSAAIDPLANLTTLSLERNKLSALPAKAFAKLTGLLEVNLGRNRIKSLSAGTFSGAAALERIALHGNGLTKLEKGLFKGLKKVKFLDLSSNKFPSLDKQDFTELLNLLYLNISDNEITKLPQSIFSRNSQLLSLNLSNNKLVEIDAYMLRGVRFLREFFAEGNQIASVARRAFGSTTRLRKLDLSHNRIEEVANEMFSNHQWLDVLDLGFNRIRTVANGAFQRLFQIAIDLSNNELVTISQGSFLEVSNITRLDLSNNNLSSLPRDTFETSDVSVLLLNGNLFSNASLIPISNLTGIKHLNLSFNQITEINRKSLTSQKLYSLESIDLSNNAIKELSGSLFEKFWALRFLDLSNNLIKKIGFGAFGNMPTLLILDLRNNHISDINSGGISNLISLKTLYLQRNSIKRMLRVPVSLNELRLEKNAISELNAGAFPMINSLLSLHLDSNNLSAIENGAFRNLLTLRTLSLARNNFSNVSALSPALQELASLQYLDLSGNRIEAVESRAFGTQNVLFQLRLDANRISEIRPYAFDGLIQLVGLNISNNEIAAIRPEAFKGLVSLSSLDVSANKLTRLENKTHSMLEDLLSLDTVLLSNNRISFITRKSFPSSPYIPNKLSFCDLSFNNIESIATSAGLEMIRNISLAHNNIRQIAPNTLTKMRLLEAIDLSSNQLTRLDKGTFGATDTDGPALQSLVAVKLANNRIEELSSAGREFLALKSLLFLDLSRNRLAAAADEFAALTKNNVQINVTGNPFHCNCELRQKIDAVRINRRARHEVQEEVANDWKALVCRQPDNLQGRKITELSAEELHCSLRAQESILVGDLALRGTHWAKRDSLRVVWLVRNRYSDIAAFKLTLALGDEPRFCQDSACLQVIELPYSSREHVFTGLDSRQHHRICISWLDTHARETQPTLDQCITAKPRRQ